MLHPLALGHGQQEFADESGPAFCPWHLREGKEGSFKSQCFETKFFKGYKTTLPAIFFQRLGREKCMFSCSLFKANKKIDIILVNCCLNFSIVFVEDSERF